MRFLTLISILFLSSLSWSWTLTPLVYSPNAAPLLKLNASFESNFSKYPSPQVLYLQMKALFPLTFKRSTYDFNTCFKVGDENAQLSLGQNKPSTGEPLTEQPSLSFFSTYSQIISCMTQAEVQSMNSAIESDLPFLGTKAYASCKKNSPYGGNISFACNWSSLTEDEKNEFIDQEISTIIGPEDIIIDYNIAASTAEVRTKIKETLNQMDGNASANLSFLGMASGQKFMLVHAWALTRFLTLSLDVLKY